MTPSTTCSVLSSSLVTILFRKSVYSSTTSSFVAIGRSKHRQKSFTLSNHQIFLLLPQLALTLVGTSSNFPRYLTVSLKTSFTTRQMSHGLRSSALVLDLSERIRSYHRKSVRRIQYDWVL